MDKTIRTFLHVQNPQMLRSVGDDTRICNLASALSIERGFIKQQSITLPLLPVRPDTADGAQLVISDEFKPRIWRHVGPISFPGMVSRKLSGGTCTFLLFFHKPVELCR